MSIKQIKELFNNKPVLDNAWKKYNETGDRFIKEINELNPQLVLDLGCGNNIYKGKINNLVGIDILDNNLQDLKCDIKNLPFKTNTVDVIIAFGSVNFGNDEIIDSQFREIIRVCKPGAHIYFRVITNHNHNCYYSWTEELLIEKSKKFNLEFLTMPKKIYKNKKENYSHWKKTGYRSSERIFCVWEVKK